LQQKKGDWRGRLGLPKDTFFNLPDEKKQRVIDAAIDEFAERSYHDARVTAIADQAGIAKGSFYQYFEDKEDLFRYIIDMIAEKKLAYINQDLLENIEAHTFFEVLRELYASGIRFAQEDPRLMAIGMQLASNQALYYGISIDYMEQSYEFFRALLEKGMDGGELDPAIDINIASRLLTMVGYSSLELIFEDGKLDQDDMAIVDDIIYIMKNGLKSKAER